MARTDVYHIGLTMTQLMATSDIIIQLSKTLSDQTRLLHLNAFVSALEFDPDLATIPSEMRAQALQTLYVATGCDYVSYFAGIGKVSFLSTFYQYAAFIAGVQELQGSLGQIQPDHGHSALYSFLRLVGCAYFRAHSSAFEFQSPVTLFHSIPPQCTVWDHHNKWLSPIRKAVWQRADNECQNLPSTEALKLHWQRCVWVLQMWHSATNNEIELPGMYIMYIYISCAYMYIK